jgi:uncharacterized membrane protein YphA (DoxX/SURF4 family)
VIARLVLAAVFVVAGIAKLADRERSRRTLRDFRMPEPLVPALAILIPVAELTTGGLLIGSATARWGAAAALALLAAFTTAIAAALRNGRQPDCGCFGRVRSAPAGPGTLARNAALAACAVLVLTGPPTSVTGWMAVLGAGVLAHVAFSWQLLRQNGRLWQRLEALERRA